MENVDVVSQFRAMRILSCLEEAISLDSLSTPKDSEETHELAFALDRDRIRARRIVYEEAVWVRALVNQHSGRLYEILVEGLDTPIVTPKHREAILRRLPNAQAFAEDVSSSVQALIDEPDTDRDQRRSPARQMSAAAAETQSARSSRRICTWLGMGFGAAVVTLNPLAVGFTVGFAIGYGCFDD